MWKMTNPFRPTTEQSADLALDAQEQEQKNLGVVEIVDALLHDAVRRGVSDIHLEPRNDSLRVRFRVDGVLHDQLPLPVALSARVISRLKVLSRIDIAERRVPQDGKLNIEVDDRAIDLRVSTFPAVTGEKLVVRVLDSSAHAMAIEQLGFGEDMLRSLTRILAKPHTFFLVTGPTGSGKTTTLYAILSQLHSPEKNTVTLEDPVEYSLSGITQGQINPQAGFTFAKGIRATLRQDPDILMVGEIRDRETAATAIEASLTGHTVLSTLHTNDAPSAVVRLMDMGIEPFLLNASLGGVLAQRLARKICQGCRVEVEKTEEYKKLAKRFNLENVTTYVGQGCRLCDNLGYKGRIGVFELLEPTNELRALSVQTPSVDALRKQALIDGMTTLAQDGVRKVREGLVSLQELARVVA